MNSTGNFAPVKLPGNENGSSPAFPGNVIGTEKQLITVEKLASEPTRKIGSCQDDLQAILPGRRDICQAAIFCSFLKNRFFEQWQGFARTPVLLPRKVRITCQ
jgi:hypothetical protein